MHLVWAGPNKTKRNAFGFEQTKWNALGLVSASKSANSVPKGPQNEPKTP